MGDPLQAGRLSETLLAASPACHWVVDAALRLVVAHGTCQALFPRGAAPGDLLESTVPDSARAAWREKAAAAVRGEPACWREARGALMFQIHLFPMPEDHAGGAAFQVTAWSEAAERLRDMALGVLRERRADRARLAKMLHDDVAQALSAAGLQLDLLRMDLEPAAPSIAGRTAEIQQVLEGVMQRVRDFSYELNPAAAERAGLYAALDRLVGRARANFRGTLRLMADSNLRLAGPIATAFFSIAETALEAALRREGCSRIEVLVKNTREGPVLEVRDNGGGLGPGDPQSEDGGLGLMMMRHYAEQAGIGLSIDTLRGQGTAVKAVYNGE